MATSRQKAKRCITRLDLRNWRNFRHVDVAVGHRLFVLGPNASGKSNLLDALRFLRDLAIDGGGLQRAVRDRGGLSRIRNLAARNFQGGQVLLRVEIRDSSTGYTWEYTLGIKAEPRGKRRPVVTQETVSRNGETLLSRPDTSDEADSERLTQTALEQVNANVDFREVAEHLASVRYLHLVPQVIREPERAQQRIDDPFGGDFLARIARCATAERKKRLKIMNDALVAVVPQLDRLELVRDEDQQPHLEARYRHWREHGAKQNERDFSDGTLRLIGLLWALLEPSGAGPVLLEEPELSLHAEVVRQLPSIIHRAVSRTGGQILATTHAHDVLDDPGLGLDEVLLLIPGDEGTEARLASEVSGVRERLESGLSLRETLHADLIPSSLQRLPTTRFG